MKKIIALMGMSGSGKDTILNKLVEIYPNLIKIIFTTSRDKRPNEVNGIDYFFVNNQYFTKNNENMLLKETFDVYDKNGNKKKWNYGINKKQFELEDNSILITTPKGLLEIYEYFKNNNNIEIIPFFIDVPLEDRFIRIKLREDNQSLAEIIRREAKDTSIFNRKIKEIQEKMNLYIIKNDKDLSKTIEEIKNIIESKNR